ncbi:MAG TPA: N-acetyl-alpha-D-glucosaminyl L-malate synthase BshA [Chitinophagales bacterium]|nr:N-acetyl-alpha-D-glucosaminyl L-malate synthase BshA [Chitinophagales bacterium]HAE35819.1 N-acetyl-alpha-D-glucosaminyl L-malate synthase BshA [Bacteroidota bacterium]HPE97620.1 N-acetyl-alpha-D-glucosaminyl L-malate synthase BshA [Chitinophagales bacterium]HPR28959.1 N-acetyl-alpha-D-glucosaminyl L-malate synthase BshA [Chitinophagales bacterium]HQU75078.1 N-acetyl-alpha-D-glucosaminyl L-malate synthase BshA [Chitinophagales bacterium]
MKIGIVCYPTYGGSGVVATELGKALADKGHQVHFITYKQPFRLDSFHENIFYHEVNFSNYPLFDYPPYETALASKIVDIAEYEQLELLHVHYAIPHASAAYLAKQILKEKGYHLPFITTLHGTDITLVGKDETFVPVVTFSINKSDGITTVSQSLKDTTYEHFDIRKDIEVIPNFIDFSRFKKLDKDHFRKVIASNGEKIIMHTSNFRKVKRVDDVVRVFCKIRQEMPAKLLLVGDGPERQNIEKMSRQVCHQDDVHFLGKQDAIEELLAISDLFILPSETESFGLAALEAMACQVPVISSNTGGLPEINIHGETGFLSPVGDVDDMAANAIRILENEETLAAFKERAFKQAQRFSLDRIMPLYEAYYIRVLEQASATA